MTTLANKPIKLVTVNTAPERAKRLIGRVVEDVKDKYTIIHAANVESKYQPIRFLVASQRANTSMMTRDRRRPPHSGERAPRFTGMSRYDSDRSFAQMRLRSRNV